MFINVLITKYDLICVAQLSLLSSVVVQFLSGCINALRTRNDDDSGFFTRRTTIVYEQHVYVLAEADAIANPTHQPTTILNIIAFSAHVQFQQHTLDVVSRSAATHAKQPPSMSLRRRTFDGYIRAFAA